MDSNTVRLVAEYVDGRPVFEEVPAVKLDESRYQLLASPGLTAGTAKGDVMELSPSEPTGFRVIQRSGIICVQLWLRSLTPAGRTEINRIVRLAGGVLDGGLDRSNGHLIIFNFRIEIGFKAIEAAMLTITGSFNVDTWMYANVYDTGDGTTPLNWWLSK